MLGIWFRAWMWTHSKLGWLAGVLVAASPLLLFLWLYLSVLQWLLH